MASHGFSLLLQSYLLLLLVQPLDPSSQPQRDTRTAALLPEELELQLQDADPELTSWVDMALVSWTCLMLLITGILLGRRLWTWWSEEKRQSPPAHAGPRCCQGRGCPHRLMELLRHNRAMLQLYLHHRQQQRPRAKRAAKGGTWKRRRPQISPQRDLQLQHCGDV